MLKINNWIGAIMMVLISIIFISEVRAEDALAFVTDVKGEATLKRADGTKEPATIGSQLFNGDEIEVTKDAAVLIYLSGRSLEVKAGESHKVQKEGTGESSALMGRLMGTLSEMAGPQSEADRPVVHGMARNIGVTGALPTNTKVSRSDFNFTWDALEEVEVYVFTLESHDGKVLASHTVKGTEFSSKSLNLQPGVRYLWSLKEADSLMPRSSEKSWVDIASKKDAEGLGKSLKEIEKNYSGKTQLLLKATAYYEEECYYEAERTLLELKGKEDLTPTIQEMLMSLYAKMGRWELLPSPEK